MIQKIKNIALIVLIVILILLVIFIVYKLLNKNREIKKLKEKQEILIEKEKELNKQLEDLKSQPTKTVKEFVYLTDNDKVKEYEKVLKQKDEAIKLADDYKNLAEDYRQQYEEAIKLADTNINWGIDLIGFGGLNSHLKPEFFTGVTVTKYFNLKLLYFGIGGGGYVNLYRPENIDFQNFDGGGAILQVKLLFKKRGY